MTPLPRTSLQLRSMLKPAGEVEISLATVAVPPLGNDDILVEIAASPMGPADLRVLLAFGDPRTARASGSGEARVLTVTVPKAYRAQVAGRIGIPMQTGIEAAGRVIAAGPGLAPQALLGQSVAVLGSGLHAQFRVMNAAAALPLPETASAADGAAAFVNPVTAIGLVETMRMDGHHALVHTAAASNLGLMVNRICLADGIGLVNVVRSHAQVDRLKAEGALHVVNSSAPDFMDLLTKAIIATGATIAFDAVGGGPLVSQIMLAIERSLAHVPEPPLGAVPSRKHVYIYGSLDPRPTELLRDSGFCWTMAGWRYTPFLQRVGAAGIAKLHRRVLAELTTIFASRFGGDLSLTDLLDPALLHEYAAQQTGRKYLVRPNGDV